MTPPAANTPRTFKEVEPREIGDLTYKIVYGAGASVVLKQETNEFQRDVLILNHIEALALRDWLNAALGPPQEPTT